MPEIGSIHPEKDYMEFLARGKFMLQKSRATGKVIFYPRVCEPGTGSTDLEWTEMSGKGVVYTTTVVRQRPPAKDYNVALIDLAEGVRMISRVDGIEPAAVTIGMSVKAKIVTENDKPLVVFLPA